MRTIEVNFHNNNSPLTWSNRGYQFLTEYEDLNFGELVVVDTASGPKVTRFRKYIQEPSEVATNYTIKRLDIVTFDDQPEKLIKQTQMDILLTNIKEIVSTENTLHYAEKYSKHNDVLKTLLEKYNEVKKEVKLIEEQPVEVSIQEEVPRRDNGDEIEDRPTSRIPFRRIDAIRERVSGAGTVTPHAPHPEASAQEPESTYKVGDRVIVKEDLGTMQFPQNPGLTTEMREMAGDTVTISTVYSDGNYAIEEEGFKWTDEMFSGLAPRVQYRIGDTVTIREDLEAGHHYGGVRFDLSMMDTRGKEYVITSPQNTYIYKLGAHRDADLPWAFTAEMFSDSVQEPEEESEYNVGDRITVREDLFPGDSYGGTYFTESMRIYRGNTYTIVEHLERNKFKLEDDSGQIIFIFTSDMFKHAEVEEDEDEGFPFHIMDEDEAENVEPYKYVVGDRVVVREDLTTERRYNNISVHHRMLEMAGKAYNIERVYPNNRYELAGENGEHFWTFTPDMFSGLAEDPDDSIDEDDEIEEEFEEYKVGDKVKIKEHLLPRALPREDNGLAIRISDRMAQFAGQTFTITGIYDGGLFGLDLGEDETEWRWTTDMFDRTENDEETQDDESGDDQITIDDIINNFKKGDKIYSYYQKDAINPSLSTFYYVNSLEHYANLAELLSAEGSVALNGVSDLTRNKILVRKQGLAQAVDYYHLIDVATFDAHYSGLEHIVYRYEGEDSLPESITVMDVSVEVDIDNILYKPHYIASKEESILFLNAHRNTNFVSGLLKLQLERHNYEEGGVIALETMEEELYGIDNPKFFRTTGYESVVTPYLIEVSERWTPAQAPVNTEEDDDPFSPFDELVENESLNPRMPSSQNEPQQELLYSDKLAEEYATLDSEFSEYRLFVKISNAEEFARLKAGLENIRTQFTERFDWNLHGNEPLTVKVTMDTESLSSNAKILRRSMEAMGAYQGIEKLEEVDFDFTQLKDTYLRFRGDVHKLFYVSSAEKNEQFLAELKENGYTWLSGDTLDDYTINHATSIYCLNPLDQRVTYGNKSNLDDIQFNPLTII